MSENISSGLMAYLQEVQQRGVICQRHQDDAAVHTKGNILQVYRLFERSSEVPQHMRNALKQIPTWKESTASAEQIEEFESMKHGVEARMKRHNELLPVITQSASWEGRPILVHAYKYEADPILKVELIVPILGRDDTDLPFIQIADALRFHEYLVPDVISTAKPPYERHETESMMSIADYLSDNMPQGLYATMCTDSMVRTPCLETASSTTSIGVGGRGAISAH